MRPLALPAPSDAPARPSQGHPPPIGLVGPVLAGALVFLFRYASLRDMTNDQFMHLSWAQQILMGDLPGRDFVDPGMPLAWASSALAQTVLPGPLGEAVFSALMFGVTSALLYWVATRLTGSRLAGCATVVAATV